MLRVLSYLLIAQFLLTIGLKIYYVVDWKLNQDYITEKYCENKDMPEMECNGQCYLAKQLQKLEQQENEERENYPNPKDKVEKGSFTGFIERTEIELVLNQFLELSKLGQTKHFMISSLHAKQVFSPPRS